MQQMLFAFRFMSKGLHQNLSFWKDKRRADRFLGDRCAHARIHQ